VRAFLPLALTCALLAPAAAPSAEAPSAEADDAVARGERVFHAAGCASCHTLEDGPPLAGGVAIETDFGVFYGPNITPDPEHGIGGWSREDLDRAMREGISPGGSPYYPSFPYTSYTGMTDEDVADLFAYLSTVEPVAEPDRAHELGLVYRFRSGLWAWRLAYFTPERFEPDPDRDGTWNRGAYLVEVLGHCGECHTPRNLAGAMRRDRTLSGNPDGPEDERIPNITPDEETGIGRWSEREIEVFLQLGMMPDGDFAGGSMGPVIRNSTSKLTAEDRTAIATYLRSLPAIRNGLGR
jgi:mono/diheme cytochrome c family protein